ncbi:hypothetical protein GCM10027566_15990 [Arachidicoccus ginsenosidivorans]|uniref:Helix-turn-helix transcriptional regulator n=2 Tax=Arachidicoccus ginsenosidivorans TaxID=496057 RepID=A0A5B8VJ01_9BACT|nr:helix-turn-helix transcriptional regulator [Arachidicoccus ginsenosidivorans]
MYARIVFVLRTRQKRRIMKSYKEIEKKHSPEEIAEALVFPNTDSISEKEAFMSEFRTFRKTLSENQTEKNKRISRLLQLKYSIEDYINSPNFMKDHFFGFFLKAYINSLGIKNKDFAAAIDIDPTELSQIINKHRNPTDKIIYRLDIHSNRNFPAVMWFRILEKDREALLLHNTELIEKEKRHVKRKLDFSF